MPPSSGLSSAMLGICAPCQRNLSGPGPPPIVSPPPPPPPVPPPPLRTRPSASHQVDIYRSV
jgi:hypothetical protein